MAKAQTPTRPLCTVIELNKPNINLVVQGVISAYNSGTTSK